MNVVDSSGWIEYLIDSPRAEVFAHTLEQTELLVVPAIAIFEVHRFLSRTVSAAKTGEAIALMCRSRVVDLTAARATAASLVAQAHRLAMADAVMYSIALEFKATFWTQDVDYQGLANVSYHAKAQAS
jgi:toxin FitB